MDERAVTAALGEGDAVTYSRRVARVGVLVMGSTTVLIAALSKLN